MHFVLWCRARMRWCNLWCISCLEWCNAHVSDAMHMNLCNAHDDALCRGAHVMVHNGAYGHGAHVMVHMRCCTWYGAHGTMHRAWCIWHDALMMMHLIWRAFHGAYVRMHRIMLVHVHGMVYRCIFLQCTTFYMLPVAIVLLIWARMRRHGFKVMGTYARLGWSFRLSSITHLVRIGHFDLGLLKSFSSFHNLNMVSTSGLVSSASLALR